MSIDFHCSRCGQLVRAPNDAGGRRGKCPYCKESIYIPSPADEIEDIPLAPLDPNDEKREAELTEEMVRTLAALDHEDKTPPESAGAGRHSETAAALPRAERGEETSLIIDFVSAMRESNLNEADAIAASLRGNAQARHEVQRMLMDEVPPPGLDELPPPLLKGFLKALMQRL